MCHQMTEGRSVLTVSWWAISVLLCNHVICTSRRRIWVHVWLCILWVCVCVCMSGRWGSFIRRDPHLVLSSHTHTTLAKITAGLHVRHDTSATTQWWMHPQYSADAEVQEVALRENVCCSTYTPAHACLFKCSCYKSLHYNWIQNHFHTELSFCQTFGGFRCHQLYLYQDSTWIQIYPN